MKRTQTVVVTVVALSLVVLAAFGIAALFRGDDSPGSGDSGHHGLSEPYEHLSLDERFVDKLASRGLVNGRSDRDAINNAKLTCEYLTETGMTPEAAAREAWRGNQRTNGTLSLDEAEFMINTTIEFYCPENG